MFAATRFLVRYGQLEMYGNLKLKIKKTEQNKTKTLKLPTLSVTNFFQARRLEVRT